MDYQELIENLGRAVISAIEFSADENARAVSMGGVSIQNTQGKSQFMKFTIVAEPTLFSKTIYSIDQPNEIAELGNMSDSPLMTTTSVVEQLKAFEKLEALDENSIRH